jgi:hypothetical protein
MLSAEQRIAETLLVSFRRLRRCGSHPPQQPLDAAKPNTYTGKSGSKRD